MVGGQTLLIPFAHLMLGVGVLMLRGRSAKGNPGAQCSRDIIHKVAGFGGLTNVFSGFFGIGGGFLIVPGLIASTNMRSLHAIGSSLVAVTAFGLTTSLNSALSGDIDWRLAAIFIAGGIVGGLGGSYLAKHLSARKGVLNSLFATLVSAVAADMLYWSLGLSLHT